MEQIIEHVRAKGGGLHMSNLLLPLEQKVGPIGAAGEGGLYIQLSAPPLELKVEHTRAEGEDLRCPSLCPHPWSRKLDMSGPRGDLRCPTLCSTPRDITLYAPKGLEASASHSSEPCAKSSTLAFLRRGVSALCEHACLVGDHHPNVVL